MVYALSIIVAFILIQCTKEYVSTIEADFEAPVESTLESMSEEGKQVTYNYFFDFSPSMQGFLYEDINTDMKRVADAFEQINAGNENNRFYWCRDNVEVVETANDFYESMRSDSILNRYYGIILRNVAMAGNDEQMEEEETPNELDRAIDNIDLSNVFASSYLDTLEDMSNLNVIVTDLNFFRDSGDVVRHNQWVDSFAQKLRTAAVNANICIYAISSDYAGRGQDAYDGSRGSLTSAWFYVIVFSENESKYIDYCSRFENVMSWAGTVRTSKMAYNAEWQFNEQRLKRKMRREI